MTLERSITWLFEESSPLHRRVLAVVAGDPSPTICVARALQEDVWSVGRCLRDLEDHWFIGERPATDPRYKREYVLTDFGRRRAAVVKSIAAAP